MKFLPLKTVILCFLLPPLFYVTTIYGATRYFKSGYEEKIEDILLFNSSEIYEGQITLEKAVEKNISQFRQNDFFLKKKLVNIEVSVIDKSGKFIYPTLHLPGSNIDQNFKINASKTAKENFEILEKGIETLVKCNLSEGLKFASALIYFTLAFSFFLFQYIKAFKNAGEYEKEKLERIKRLEKEEEKYKTELSTLETEKRSLAEKINSLNEKYRETRSSEEEMLDEIISLEEKLKSFNDSQDKKELEIEELKIKLEELEKKRNIIHRKKDFDFLSKRFETLYKNVIMTKKAYNGFIELEEELQIKAEELIHLLNNDPEKVIIKRKVFSGKRSKSSSFEVIFGYNGRIYFSKSKGNKIKVILIGTKNTQNKDMDYLHNL